MYIDVNTILFSTKQIFLVYETPLFLIFVYVSFHFSKRFIQYFSFFCTSPNIPAETVVCHGAPTSRRRLQRRGSGEIFPAPLSSNFLLLFCKMIEKYTYFDLVINYSGYVLGKKQFISPSPPCIIIICSFMLLRLCIICPEKYIFLFIVRYISS